MGKFINLLLLTILSFTATAQEFNVTQRPYIPKNYIKNSGLEAGLSGFKTYSDTPGTSPVDGTGGSPSVTIASSATTPLAGTRSLVFTKDASNRQGQGASIDFTIDNEDRGKVLQGSFTYLVNSGTYANDDVSIYVYDVTNTTIITPSPRLLKTTADKEKFTVRFLSSSTSNSYRLIFHVASTSALAYSLKIDSVETSISKDLFLTTTQKNALIAVAGMEVYDTDLNIKQYYNGSQWVANTSIQLDNEYSAQMNASGVVTNENRDWINGSCSYASSEWTCTYTSGVVTSAMNCAVNVTDDTSGASVRGVVSSSTTIKFKPIFDGTGYFQKPVSIICQKGTSDYRSTDAYISSNGNSDRTSFTPTFSAGFGTVTGTNCYKSRDGNELVLSCNFTTGTVASSVATMTLPDSLTTASTLSTYTQVGTVAKGNAIAINNNVIAAPSSTTINFSGQGATNSSLTAYNGNDIFASSTAYSIQARIPIQGWTNSNIILASLQGVPTTPGSTKKMDFIAWNFGTTNATTDCTASPCSYIDLLGTGGLSSQTRSSTGAYLANFPVTYSKLKCTFTGWNGGSNVLAFLGNTPVQCTNCNSIAINIEKSGSATDAHGLVTCWGEL